MKLAHFPRMRTSQRIQTCDLMTECQTPHSLSHGAPSLLTSTDILRVQSPLHMVALSPPVSVNWSSRFYVRQTCIVYRPSCFFLNVININIYDPTAYLRESHITIILMDVKFSCWILQIKNKKYILLAYI